MKFSYVREVDEYPVGGRRMKILTMAVLASLICSYEGVIAPIVTLLLDDLNMDLATYGSISAAAAIVGACAGLWGGHLTDKVGRVKLLVPLMLLTSLLCFAMTMVSSPSQLLYARIIMAFIDGIAIASTAPLVRDFSPRMGRAQAFGFWTWGPVGANFIAAAIAAATLSMFNNSWESQFIIMGCISFVASIAIALNIAELSPTLRATILKTELQAMGKADESKPARFRDLLPHKVVWAHCIGIAFWLVLYLTLTVYGQAMLEQTFGRTAAEASQIMMAFWIVDLGTVILFGRWSDKIQLRRIFSVVGTVVSLILLGYLIVLMGDPNTSNITLMITGGLLGSAMGAAYSPWMANYSENAEDIDPRLQGTAFGLFSFVVKAILVLVLIIAPLVVAASNWQVWIIVTAVCMALFGIASIFFKGPWFNAKEQPPTEPAVEDMAIPVEEIPVAGDEVPVAQRIAAGAPPSGIGTR